jgi:predicted SprT family Zn-dependent metalloprotease
MTSIQPGLTADLDRLAQLWGAPGLPERSRVEFSSRLRRSLGLCYPQRDLIRLNPVLLKSGNREMLDETLVHEAAHLVVYWRHGRRVRPHGQQWQALMHLAGLPARATIPHSKIKALPTVLRARYLYRHRCLDCGNVFNAGRTDRRWRCSSCHQWGRGGVLKVIRLPIRH